jgi:Ser/Thr protein kinase RdoA (MazF antagonist)
VSRRLPGRRRSSWPGVTGTGRSRSPSPNGYDRLSTAAVAGLGHSWVERAVTGLARWPYGPFRVFEVTRIGAEHGLSGQVHRVMADTGSGGRVSFIVKREGESGAERAMRFHAVMADRLSGSIPQCYGGTVDATTGMGILFLEDVAPAVQGDVLIDPGERAAAAAIRVIARVHAASWREHSDDHVPALPRWHAEVWDSDHWSERLAGARARFPDVLTAPVEMRLERLPGQLGPAIARLQAGPASWIHADAHLDNFLWRPDGRAVLLDWSGAVIGPPAVDVARFIIEGRMGIPGDTERSVALIGAYREELEARGVSSSAAATVSIAVDRAILPLAQGIIGWAGRPESEPPGPRMASLRENGLRNVAACLSR